MLGHGGAAIPAMDHGLPSKTNPEGGNGRPFQAFDKVRRMRDAIAAKRRTMSGPRLPSSIPDA
jgi:hypothetical protein